MKEERKNYETPEVTKVEFDASDRITRSACDPKGQDNEPNECAWQ